MSYKVNDYLSIAIYIEGKELPLDHGNQLNVLHLAAMSQYTLPTLHLEFVDVLRVVPSLDLQDGAKITVSMQGTSKVDRYFRVHDWKRSPSGDGFAYGVNCYWDSPLYYLGTANAGIEDSSYGALEAIASKCNLEFWGKNTKTSDVMLWMQSNSTYGMFARSIARCGFVDETSHMVLVVDSLGYMRYVNVNANPSPNLTVGYLSTGDDNFLVIKDFMPKTNSGMNNALGGYRHNRYVQSIASQSLVEEDSVLSFTPDSKFPLISAAVRDKMERGSITYGALDFGNVHPQYERARYQNNRYNLLNSVVGEFLFAFPTKLEPTDNFNYIAPSTAGNTQYNGEYTISGKVIFIVGSDYNEKIIAVKNGLS